MEVKNASWDRVPDYDERPDLKARSNYDIEANTEKLSLLVDVGADIRNQFIRKVYGIVFILLAITMAVAIPFVYVPQMQSWFIQNSMLLFFMPSILAIVVIVLLGCVPGLDKKFPWNIILCGILAICYGILLGGAGAYSGDSVFWIAVGLTCLIVVALSIFACQTKFDFSGAGPYLLVALIVLVSMSFIGIFVSNSIFNTVIASIGLFLFSCFLVYDTQRIVGGKHVRHQFSVDDFILASISLYIDIINILFNLINLLS
eukprot:GHVP01059668.1.p1 GENE.GHVP01059668.1~~GHVP01059668.1.p1  ORF type:complete len:259 (-),score=15.51 GHVP01059668.1:751-1527(-)